MTMNPESTNRRRTIVDNLSAKTLLSPEEYRLWVEENGGSTGRSNVKGRSYQQSSALSSARKVDSRNHHVEFDQNTDEAIFVFWLTFYTKKDCTSSLFDRYSHGHWYFFESLTVLSKSRAIVP